MNLTDRMPIDTVYKNACETGLQMIESGGRTQDILIFLTKSAEKAAGPDTVSSILLLDKEGLLRNGASPKLPPDYLKAIDGLKPDPFIGTCAAAAATGLVVVTEDFSADNKWAELRHLPQSLGFTGAWSTPILGDNGKVLGTFGTYFRKKRIPTEAEIKGVKLLASIASLALLSTSKD
jgi:GAF domain-containing protein